MSFLDGLIKAKPPLKPFCCCQDLLKYFYLSFEALSTLSQCNQDYNPSPSMKFTPTTELSGGTFLHGGYTELK